MYPVSNDASWSRESQTLKIERKEFSYQDKNTMKLLYDTIPDITDKIINLHLELNFQKNLPKLKLTNNYRNVLINLFFPEKVYNMNREAFNATKFRNAVNELNPLFKNNEKIELKEYINYFILKLHDELNVKKDSFSRYHENSNNEMELSRNVIFIWIFSIITNPIIGIF